MWKISRTGHGQGDRRNFIVACLSSWRCRYGVHVSLCADHVLCVNRSTECVLDEINASLERIKAMFPAWKEQCKFVPSTRAREWAEAEAMAVAEAQTRTDDLFLPLAGANARPVRCDNSIRVVVGPVLGKVRSI